MLSSYPLFKACLCIRSKVDIKDKPYPLPNRENIPWVKPTLWFIWKGRFVPRKRHAMAWIRLAMAEIIVIISNLSITYSCIHRNKNKTLVSMLDPLCGRI